MPLTSTSKSVSPRKCLISFSLFLLGFPIYFPNFHQPWLLLLFLAGHNVSTWQGASSGSSNNTSIPAPFRNNPPLIGKGLSLPVPWRITSLPLLHHPSSHGHLRPLPHLSLPFLLGSQPLPSGLPSLPSLETFQLLCLIAKSKTKSLPWPSPFFFFSLCQIPRNWVYMSCSHFFPFKNYLNCSCQGHWVFYCKLLLSFYLLDIYAAFDINLSFLL